MDSQSILALAKQGDANASATLINNSLKERCLGGSQGQAIAPCFHLHPNLTCF
ncbi:MAG: hypothetical protein PUP90_05260 [Nostoc sp. S4]|nr:hypothetical protein [Nostoc sp. S4]